MIIPIEGLLGLPSLSLYTFGSINIGTTRICSLENEREKSELCCLGKTY